MYSLPTGACADAGLRLGVKYESVIGHTPVTWSAMCYNVTNKKGWYSADQGNQILAADPRAFVVSAEIKF